MTRRHVAESGAGPVRSRRASPRARRAAFAVGWAALAAVSAFAPALAAKGGPAGGGFVSRPAAPGSALRPLDAARGRLPGPGARAVELAETVPVETRLGHPGLRAARHVWVEMIRGARRTLDLEQFYLSAWPREPMDDVVRAVAAAGRRGVRVRLLLDARMHDTYPQPADSLAGLPGIEVRTIDLRPVTGGVQHAKFFVVDGEQVFVGSQNFDWRALKHIHELGVRVRDRAIAAAFARTFETDWALARPPGAAPDSTRRPRAAPDSSARAWMPVPVVQTRGDTVWTVASFSPRSLLPDSTVWDRDAIVRLIDGARGEVVVQLLNYGVGEGGRRDETIDRALRDAGARGVKVRILVSDWQADSDRIVDVQRLATAANVEVKMSSVPEWSRGYIPFARVEHCKFMVVDTTWTWVGTSNWEPGYFHGSRNAAVSLRNRRLAGQARATFETSWRAPSAAVLDPGRTYEPRIHRETPPPGRQVYGR